MTDFSEGDIKLSWKNEDKLAVRLRRKSVLGDTRRFLFSRN